MTALAPALQAYFTERLINQRNSSPETIAAYRNAFRLLLRFAAERTGKQPFELDLDDLDAPLIGSFLKHLEDDRGNSPRTRNARLGAIHSFYRFAALEHPEHALLTLMIQTGVRVSELTGLRIGDAHLDRGPHIQVLGKGRKRRATTLTRETVAVLRAWLKERRGQPDEPLFPTRQGRPLSRYTVGVIVAKHAATAASGCPSLQFKRVTPHTLRHANAMLLRAKGVDLATIGLWLGHESVQTTRIYEHADPKLKEQAIARTAPLGTKPGRYRPSDQLLAFLDGL